MHKSVYLLASHSGRQTTESLLVNCDSVFPPEGPATARSHSPSPFERTFIPPRRNEPSTKYDYLKPVADLRKQGQDRLYVLLQNPLRRDPAEPTDGAEKQQVFDSVASALSATILDVATSGANLTLGTRSSQPESTEAVRKLDGRVRIAAQQCADFNLMN